MKYVHWIFNIALFLAGFVCLWIAFSYKIPNLVDKIGCSAAGIAFIVIGIIASVYTYKKG